MERTISQEERIRKAEEIYNRRRQENNRTYREKYARNEERNENINIKGRMLRRLIIQILVCLIIYLGLSVINDSNAIFSEDVNKKIEEFLSYDISAGNVYNSFMSYLNDENSFINKILNINDDNKTNETNEINETNEETVNETVDENADTNEIENQNIEEAIGGAEVENIAENKSQEELDIEYIKNNYNIDWPLRGTITSRFGTREPTEIVTANHYGLDIGGNIGDTIVAAMDGTVTLLSSEGDYGKHIRIENNDILTLYAHCSKLCVEEGATVKQGDKIAEVGQTGRATGPHLHFEIRVANRAIDPELIL